MQNFVAPKLNILAVFLGYRDGILQELNCQFLCHGYQYAGVLRYHQFQHIFTINIIHDLIGKKEQKKLAKCNRKLPIDHVPSNRETISQILSIMITDIPM